MSSSIGKQVRVTVFGESRGPAVGCVIEGLPAGFPLDREALAVQMARRAPGHDDTASPRVERDMPEIVSGLSPDGLLTGAPLCALIRNEDARDDGASDLPRPGHADYTGFVRYGGFADRRGGGHFSGRLTAPLVFAGAVCRQILATRGIAVGAHIARIAAVRDDVFDPVHVSADTLKTLSEQPFPLLDPAREPAMRAAIGAARSDNDSVGGIIEAAAVGLPAGIGTPLFDGIENRLSALLFGIPAVKGVEFGDGFGFADLRGSAAADPFAAENGRVVTLANHNGGILGGITTGMPLLLRVAVKPTPSIGKPLGTVDPKTMEPATVTSTGRNDPCIVPRAAAVIENVLALGLLDLLETEAPHD